MTETSDGDARRALEAAFNDQMVDIYRCALREIRYRATRFLQLVSELGGLRAAQRLLESNELARGLMELRNAGRLDLSMEHLVLQEPWNQLFTPEELQRAQERLDALQ